MDAQTLESTPVAFVRRQKGCLIIAGLKYPRHEGKHTYAVAVGAWNPWEVALRGYDPETGSKILKFTTGLTYNEARRMVKTLSEQYANFDWLEGVFILESREK